MPRKPPAADAKPRLRFSPEQIVYLQGYWRCRVLQDFGESIQYIALEGAPRSYDGHPLIAAADLFETDFRPATRVS